MKVVDAGALVAVLTGRIAPERFGDEDLIAPHLLDSEVLQVLRSLVRHGHLTEEQGRLAVGAFLSVEIARGHTTWLAARIWQYRYNLTAAGTPSSRKYRPGSTPINLYLDTTTQTSN